MREHLYRGKDRETGKWVFGSLLSWDAGERHICCEDDNEAMEKFPVIPETVGEYTGLKDKNGVKIFEGDIVRYVYMGTGYRQRKKREITLKGQVVFKNENGGWTVENAFGNKLGCHIIAIQGWEIIGNIHDNPELLQVN